MKFPDWQRALEANGYVVLPGVFSPAQLDEIVQGLEKAFANDTNGSTMRSADGNVYGARNLLQLFPASVNLWMEPTLLQVLAESLGSEFGLVRVLYFDKPPEQSWALP